MKNRDHTNISKRGTINLYISRLQRSKPVAIYNPNNNFYYEFFSYSECARFLNQVYQRPVGTFADRLRRRRSHIYDFDIIYLWNAETRHDSSTEQGIVHKDSDLSTDYHNFNDDKQAEVEDRVKHTVVQAIIRGENCFSPLVKEMIPIYIFIGEIYYISKNKYYGCISNIPECNLIGYGKDSTIKELEKRLIKYLETHDYEDQNTLKYDFVPSIYRSNFEWNDNKGVLFVYEICRN